MGSVVPADVADIDRHKEVIAEQREGRVMATTRTVLGDEVALLRFAVNGQRRFRPLASEVPQEPLAGLSEQQKRRRCMDVRLHRFGAAL